MNSIVSAASLAAVTNIACATEQTSFPELAAQFDAIYARWLDRCKRGDAEAEDVDQLIFERTGLLKENYPEYGEAGWDLHAKMMREIREELEPRYPDPLNEDGQSIEWNEIHDELFPLARAILSAEAKSLADLALQARALALANDAPWLCTRAADFNAKETRLFVDSVARFLCVDLLPGREIEPISYLEGDDDSADEEAGV